LDNFRPDISPFDWLCTIYDIIDIYSIQTIVLLLNYGTIIKILIGFNFNELWA